MFYILITTLFFDLTQFLNRHRALFIGLLSFAVLSVVFAYIPLYTTPEDTLIYQLYYTHPDWISGFEPGYVLFMNIVRSTGISYWTFRWIIAVIGFLFFCLGLSKFRVNVASFVFLYALIPFLEDTIQLRNFLMASISFYAISFLIDKSVKNVLIATVLIVVASSFQTLGLFGLVIIFVRVFDSKKGFRMAFFAITCLLTILFAVPSIRSGLVNGLVMPFVNLLGRGQHIQSFVLRMRPGTITIVDIAANISLVLIVYTAKRLIENGSDVSSKTVTISELIFDVTIAITLAMPMYFMAYNFDRILKNAFSFFFIFVLLFSRVMWKRSLSSFFIWNLAIILLCSLYAVAYYTYGTRLDQVVIPVLFQNTFLEVYR